MERTLAGPLEQPAVPGAMVSVRRDGWPMFGACPGTVSVDRPAAVRDDNVLDIGAVAPGIPGDFIRAAS